MSEPGKRILIVRQTGLSGTQAAASLCNALASSGFAVSLLILNGDRGRYGLDDAIDLIGQCQPGVGRLRAASELKKVFRDRHFDIVYVVDSWTIPVFWLATSGSMKVAGARVVYHTFDWLEPGNVAWWHPWFEKRMCRKADLVVNTDRARARMQKTIYGLAEVPLWVQNSLSIKEKLLPEKPETKRILLGRDASDSDRIVIYPTVVGSSRSQRRVKELLQAIPDMPKEFHVVLFRGSGEEYKECRRIIAELGIDDRVTFLEKVEFQKLREYVCSSDYGAIFYSDEESSGYFMCNADKLSLYASCGVPYLASDFPNLEAVTYKHEIGVCCDSSDPREIAQGFAELQRRFSSDSRRNDIRSTFEEHLCLERHIGVLVEALEKL